MKLKFIFAFLFLFLLVGTVKADSLSLTINFIVPEEEDNPEFTNLQNFTHTVNTTFDFDFDATDDDGISCFVLNDTSRFDINCSGYIENNTALDEIETYNLIVTVNDTLGYSTNGTFYINVQGVIIASNVNYISPHYPNSVPYIKIGRRLNFKT